MDLHDARRHERAAVAALCVLLAGCGPTPVDHGLGASGERPAPARERATRRPASVGAKVAAFERELLELHNAARRRAGVAPLIAHWDLRDDARRHSARMASGSYCPPGRPICHSSDAELSAVIEGWWRLGENVGVSPSASALHQAFIGSAGHRETLLGADYNFVGVGAAVGADGRYYVTVTFADLTPFGDTADSPAQRAIWTLWGAGITDGCRVPPRGRYCPAAPVSRAAVAKFLSLAFDLPQGARDHFVDDDGAWYEAHVDALADAGIAGGCNPPDGDRFCPARPATRGRLAAMLARARSLAAGGSGDSDEGSLAGGGHADSAGVVTRGQMADLLVRAALE